MTSTEKTFEAVLSDFKMRLTAKEVEDFQFVTLQDVRKTALRIQQSHEQSGTLMTMARLESFLEAMNQFGKVIEVFGNASIFVAFIWGPMKFILQTASTWADSFEVLVDAYSQIGEHMPLLEQYEALFTTSPHMGRVLALLYADILSFHRRAIRFFSGKATVWRQIFRSTWKDFDARFKQILDGLSRHKNLITEQSQLLHFQQSQADSQRLRLHIEQYERDREQAILQDERREQAEMDRKSLAALEWFAAAPSTKQDHDVFRNTRKEYAGTGEWILRDEKVQNWREPDIPSSSVLWINGIPGAGKTILASVIIDSCMQDPSSTTAYFYCKENDTEKNECISVFRGLLSQLLSQCREVVPYCYDKFLSSGETILTTPNVAEQLLKLFCEKIEKQYIIIDGLDECDPAQRRLILSFLMTTVDRCDERDPGKLRVLFVSQHCTDVEKALQTATILKLTADHNEKDITAYTLEWSRRIQQKYSLESQTVEDIQDMTCIRSQGMFLFAKLVMENMFAQETQQNVFDEISEYRFPKGLEDAYERIIQRMKRNLKPVQWSIAHKLLGWMVCAKRPLKWREIQAAISINPETQSIEFDRRKLRSEIQEYCGSLVQVFEGDRVELVHTTAKMHITRTGYISAATVECNLASICLRYLTFECFDEDVTPERLYELTLDGMLSFQDYAVAKWSEHIRAIVITKSAVFSDNEDSQLALEGINLALGEFEARYDYDYLYSSCTDNTKQDCQPFKGHPFYDKLLHIWDHILCHAQKGSEARNDISLESLSIALFRNRKLLETLSSGNPPLASSTHQSLTTFYGDRRFHCPKLTCFYFHTGFPTDKSRAQHLNRHDRPFGCIFPDCSIASFGFSSNKDLEKHKRFFHPELEEQATSFSTAVAEQKTAKKGWECNICGKAFTRGFHQRNHLKSHAGIREHVCGECGRAFTRVNDLRRHEKLHARR